jgi:hypothetical protein
MDLLVTARDIASRHVWHELESIVLQDVIDRT